MTTAVPSPRAAEGRDVQLLTAQLDVLTSIVGGGDLHEVLGRLITVLESVSDSGVLGSVLLLDGDGLHLRHGAAPSLPAYYNEAIDGIAIGPTVGSCGTAAYRREQVIVDDIGSDPLWADFRELAGEAGLAACWSTPILSGDGDLLGTFAMYYPQPQRPTPGDLALINVLVRTVGVAIERSHADEEREQALATERAAALTLQHSLLPEVPPVMGRLRLDARYRTGDPGVEVGGDWFDAISVDEGVVVVVGDVQGHDLGAAALMGQLRTVVRAYAAEGHPPASILSHASSYLERLDTDRLATVLVVHLDTDARVVTTASAGHLPPLLLIPDGARWRTEDGDVAVGPPLGIGREWGERTSALAPGSAVLLYTDGLVETRAWALDEGLSRLHAAVARVPSEAGLGTVLDTALELVPTGLRGDDVAVVAALLPATVAENRSSAQRWLPPQPMSTPLARSWVRGVLATWSLPAGQVEATSLVITEFVTNALRNTDDALRVRVQVEDRTRDVLVEVYDRSHRLPYLPDTTVEDTAGRGLRIVDRLAEDWGVREETDGKTVWARIGQVTQEE